MTYEELKKWRIESKRRKRIGTNGSGQGKGETDLTKLVSSQLELLAHPYFGRGLLTTFNQRAE